MQIKEEEQIHLYQIQEQQEMKNVKSLIWLEIQLNGRQNTLRMRIATMLTLLPAEEAIIVVAAVTRVFVATILRRISVAFIRFAPYFIAKLEHESDEHVCITGTVNNFV